MSKNLGNGDVQTSRITSHRRRQRAVDCDLSSRRRTHSRYSKDVGHDLHSNTTLVATIKDYKSVSKSDDVKSSKLSDTYNISTDMKKVIMPGLDGHLKPFRCFMNLQDAYISMEDSLLAYDKYKAEYDLKQKQIFYSIHKDDSWLKETYDPLLKYKIQGERHSEAQVLNMKFGESLKNGDYQGISLEGELPQDFETKYFKIKSETSEASKAPLFLYTDKNYSIFIPHLSLDVSRWDLLKDFKNMPGFVTLPFSHAYKTHGITRSAWVIYDCASNLEKGLEAAQKLSYHGLKNATDEYKVKYTLLLNKSCISNDRSLTKKLIQAFDKVKSIKDNIIFNEEKSRHKTEQLDLQLLYLRKVHAFCYYCCLEGNDENMLSSKCGSQHVRVYKSSTDVEDEDINDYNEMSFNDEKDEKIQTHSFLEKSHSEKVEKFISKEIKKAQNPETTELHELRLKYCYSKIRQISEDKVSCQLGDKLFIEDNYAVKHIFARHYDQIYEFVDKKFFEKVTEENYMKDQNKLINKPSFFYKKCTSKINSIKDYQQPSSTTFGLPSKSQKRVCAKACSQPSPHNSIN